MRISDWSSDVCSSDLAAERGEAVARRPEGRGTGAVARHHPAGEHGGAGPVKPIAAAFAAALLCASGAVAVPEPGPNQAVIDGADMPKQLSAFGIFRTGTREPVDALLPYTLHTPLFSDYDEKPRLIRSEE